MRAFTVWLASSALAILGAASMASADNLSFDLDTVISGGPSTPGANVLLSDTAANTVQVTLDASAFSAFRFNDWYLNLDPGLNLDNLTISQDSGPAFDSIGKQHNEFQADGDGKFDINIKFGPPGGVQFEGGNQAVFTFVYAGGSFDVHSFDFSSVEGGGQGTFKAAVHITALADGASVWMGEGGAPVIPTPAAAAGGLALMGLIGLRRRQSVDA